MSNFYISDMHFGHKNCIAFDNRPFTSVEEMDDAMIANWNNAVSSGDTVYILGDMCWGKQSRAIEILQQLNGDKVLIKGNHDKLTNVDYAKQFIKVADYLEIEDAGKHIVLCHYPITCFRNQYYGWAHFYGHVHTGFQYNMVENFRYQVEALYDKKCVMVNVGAMMPYIGYTPRTAEYIFEHTNNL